MSDIKAVTIHKINLGGAMLRKYSVQYFSGISRTFGIPPKTVEKFIRRTKGSSQK